MSAQIPARSARREATRRRLLDAAVAAFGERGFYGTSVEDICERAGFTRGAFYSNFSSRDDLVLELYQIHADELSRFISQTAQREDLSPSELLLAIVDGWEDRMPDRAAWHLLMSEFSLHALRDEAAGTAYARLQTRLREQVCEAITLRLAQDGLELTVPCDQLMRLCFAVTAASTDQHLLEPNIQPRGELERRFLPALVDSLLRPV